MALKEADPTTWNDSSTQTDVTTRASTQTIPALATVNISTQATLSTMEMSMQTLETHPSSPLNTAASPLAMHTAATNDTNNIVNHYH